jgi:hypothetical protein
MYKIVNLAAITAIAIFKPSPLLIAAYSLVDCFFIQRNNDRGVQLLVHHAATVGLCALRDDRKVIEDILEIEKSTALIMVAKIVKPLKPVALAYWIYQRCWYFPRLVERIKGRNSVGHILLATIRNLGVLWTLEGFKMPLRYLRPCVFSTVSFIAPLLVKTWRTGNVPLFLHTAALVGSSIAHHSHHRLGSIQHIIDHNMVVSYMIHLFCIQNDLKCYLKWLVLCIADIKIMRARDREWTNIVELAPHMALHDMCYMGTTEILEKKYSHTINEERTDHRRRTSDSGTSICI